MSDGLIKNALSAMEQGEKRLEVRRRVAKILENELSAWDDDAHAYKPLAVADHDTVKSLGGDSLDEFEVIMAVEREFNVTISDEKWHGPRYDYSPTVAQIVEIVLS